MVRIVVGAHAGVAVVVVLGLMFLGIQWEGRRPKIEAAEMRGKRELASG
jgi:hypothetical protein